MSDAAKVPPIQSEKYQFYMNDGSKVMVGHVLSTLIIAFYSNKKDQTFEI